MLTSIQCTENASDGVLILAIASETELSHLLSVTILSIYIPSFSVIYSDISGGYSPSIFNAMRVAIHASKALSLTMNQTNYRPLTHHEAFYLATMGGAQG